ncbi:MAG: sigma-70 family RNA polymerase sigma factor [Candidatus Limnocylindrales bacterium]|nr:sigma-70 family RNA polymerase sigma factor [Candidatus Limnocylindrales bacterium]
MTGLAATAIASEVQRAAAGDEAAFARIVAAHHAEMARIAYGVCGDSGLAEDAVQAAWSIAWRKLRTLRDPDRLRPWLVTVAVNEARHLVRRRGIRPVIELEIDACDARAPDLSDEIDRVDLVNALRRLTPDERALLALRYGAGFDSSEIGPMLGLSASGARARLARLLGRLRKDLDDD